MDGRILAFADLLAPVRLETFFEQHWENKPLHIRRSEGSFYENLLTDRDIEAAIASGGLRYPAIQLAKDGGFFPAEAFTKNIRSGDDVFTGVPNLERIRTEYQSGATISLPAFHRAWQPLGALAAAIEDDFDHPVHTNVYLTPGNAAGFRPHYDTHEVFVLQIAGHKHWRIHEPSVPLPHRSQPFDPRHWSSSAPLLEVDLAPGDLLYLPRGFVHATATSDSFSAHVTLGITVYTWVELLADWIQSSKNWLSLRRALPPGFAGQKGVMQSLRNQLPGLIAELQRMTDYEGLLDGFSHRVRSARVGARADFHADVVVIGPRTELKALERDRYVVVEESGKIVLNFGGKTLVMEKNVRPALDEICRRPKFSASELSRYLGEGATLALVRSLYKEGFLSASRR
ncbi:MAG TPA: cupin domain-containing protein [Stellaceae bacterium]|nr:cupin domain-containing protein [Stellaceae bacterium]